MQFLRELPCKYSKELRCTLVKGHDDQNYVIYTIQLYPFLLDDGRANFETVVHFTDANGDYGELKQQYTKRYHTREEALKNHERVLQEFDRLLQLEPAKKPAAAAHAAPAAPAVAAPEKK